MLLFFQLLLLFINIYIIYIYSQDGTFAVGRKLIKSVMEFSRESLQRNIKSVLEFSRESLQHNIKSVLEFSGERLQRNIKSLLEFSRESIKRNIKSVFEFIREKVYNRLNVIAHVSHVASSNSHNKQKKKQA